MTLRCALSVLAVLAVSTAAEAQAPYPSQAVRIVVPYAPGGVPDTVARFVAAKLQARIGQSVVVENRAGGNGSVAASAIAAAPADGYTLMVTDSAMLSVNPLFLTQLSYNPQKDFVPVALLARAPIFLAVHSDVPVWNLREFIDHVKARPGQLTYGSSGVGSTHHLTMEAMKAALGLNITHVPYRGTGQSVPALLGGHVQALFSAYPSLKGAVETSRVKLLATNGAQRSPLAPDVPSLAEIIPGFDLITLIGMYARAGTPSAVVEKIAAEAVAVVKEADVVPQFAALGMEPAGEGPAAFARTIDAEIARVTRVVEGAGIKPQ
ncbi:MAG: tripartite tricarboxylate transporter substrate binding protein [Xanthobacteraceae bacterium]|nr:tripartite tricarboxylate transporter substrate binding protein [Xanthobacteraceae bacterium]